jgi:hypothetical protein
MFAAAYSNDLRCTWSSAMDIDSVEIDDAELALLYLTLHGQFCV